MRLSVHYDTTYRFSRPATGLIQLLRLTPRSCANQNVLDWRIGVDCDARLREGRDGYGNITHMLYVDQPLDSLTVSVTGDILTEDRSGVMSGLGNDLPREVFLRHTPLTQPDAALKDLTAALLHQGGTQLEMLHRLNASIGQRLEFEVGATQAGTTAAEAYAARRGVCQDFAHVFIALLRQIGVPARYVSGYLFHRKGENDRSADGATHAWVEALMPDLGWIGLDPTNNITAGERHIRVAIGRDYADVPPTRGVFKGSSVVRSELAVAVRVGPAQQSGILGDATPFIPWISHETSSVGLTMLGESASQQQQQQ